MRRRAPCRRHARDASLAGRSFFCDRFTVADVAYFLTIGFASQLGAPPAPEHQNLAAWLARVGERPAIQQEMAGMMAAAQSL